MAFERKETPGKEPTTTFWTVLKWYWILFPVLYFTFVVPNMFEETASAEVGDASYFTMTFLLLNLALAGILIYIDPLERTRDGAADNVLKIAFVQQLLTQNILGVILTLGTWYKLPNKVNPELIPAAEAEKTFLKPKTLYILTGIVLVATIILIVIQYFVLNN